MTANQFITELNKSNPGRFSLVCETIQGFIFKNGSRFYLCVKSDPGYMTAVDVNPADDPEQPILGSKNIFAPTLRAMVFMLNRNS